MDSPIGSKALLRGAAFEKIVEQKWMDALDIAAKELAGWWSSTPNLKKTTTLARKAIEAKVSNVAATDGSEGGGGQHRPNWSQRAERDEMLVCRVPGSMGIL
jgi:hypothetical protein